MNHSENLPVLTLKHSPQREDHALRPQPVCVLKRRHSQTQCLVYSKHPRRPAYLGARADPSTISTSVHPMAA